MIQLKFKKNILTPNLLHSTIKIHIRQTWKFIQKQQMQEAKDEEEKYQEAHQWRYSYNQDITLKLQDHLLQSQTSSCPL